MKNKERVLRNAKERLTLMSSTRTVLSSEALMMYLKEGWKSTARTQFSCAAKVCRHTPLRGSQSFTVRSREPDAR